MHKKDITIARRNQIIPYWSGFVAVPRIILGKVSQRVVVKTKLRIVTLPGTLMRDIRDEIRYYC